LRSKVSAVVSAASTFLNSRANRSVVNASEVGLSNERIAPVCSHLSIVMVAPSRIVLLSSVRISRSRAACTSARSFSVVRTVNRRLLPSEYLFCSSERNVCSTDTSGRRPARAFTSSAIWSSVASRPPGFSVSVTVVFVLSA
jgi:hypothetical protein